MEPIARSPEPGARSLDPGPFQRDEIMKRTCVRLLAVIVVGWMLPTVLAGERADNEGAPSLRNVPSAWHTALKLARSRDGITFTEINDAFLDHASGPDLVVLPGGDLLALFDHALGDDPGRPTVMVVSRSKDRGKSWSLMKPIRLRGGRGQVAGGRRGDLIAAPDGRLRLFFSIPSDPGVGKSRRPATILSAITRDGLDYRVDAATRVRVTGMSDAHVAAVWFRSRLHLFIADWGRGFTRASLEKRKTEHYLSPDGRRFLRLGPGRIQNAHFVGSIVPLPRALRAYVSSPTGIRSFISTNARDWKLEPGLRLAGGWDPGVVRLKDGSFLMLYCTALQDDFMESAPLVRLDSETIYDAEAGLDDPPVWNVKEANQQDGDDGVEDHSNKFDRSAGAASDIRSDSPHADEVEAGSEPASSDDSMVVASKREDGPIPTDSSASRLTSEIEDESTNGATESERVQPPVDVDDVDTEWGRPEAGNGLENWDPAASDGFAPRPDFKTKVDYIAWYRDFALSHPVDNAYDAYSAFMPDFRDEPGSKPDWPVFRDMHHSADYDGPPAPWNPAEHPEWEASHIEIQSLLAQYHEASRHEGYATPPITSNDLSEGNDRDQSLLIDLLLPMLSPHRTLAKATLANAWRLEDGRVSPKRMTQAWETTLRAASHLEGGTTLIEDLVASAERKLVQDHALWALEHDVFSSADELEVALDTLRQFDRSTEGIGDSLRFEYAFSMDATQYLFSPPTTDGQPRFNAKHLEAVADWGLSDDDDTLEEVSRMTPDDVHASLDAFDTRYREMTELMNTGYPDVRATDIDAFVDRTLQATPLTRLFLPSLSRYYKLRVREETSRRATQLAYAARLFQARNGRWPESIGELPDEYGSLMRIDPFTGDEFGYRLTEEGPVIYSLSENGLDDGGVHSPRWDDQITNDVGSDDHVFWPPQPR